MKLSIKNFDYKKISSAVCITRALYFVAALIILLGVFHAGMMVGYHKAKFSFHMGEKYYRAFEGDARRDGKLGGFLGRDFPDAHGAVGQIVKIDLPRVIVLGPDQIEKIVVLNEDTKIRHFRDEVSASNLGIGAFVVVIGSPTDSAEITARLIRIMPPPNGTRGKSIEEETISQ